MLIKYLARGFVVNAYIRKSILFAAIFALLSLSMQTAMAHAPRENYIWVNVEQDHLSGRFEINVRDLNKKLGIDVDAAGPDRQAGVLASAATVQQYLIENFAILDNGKPMALQFLAPRPFKEGPDFIQYPYRTSRSPSSSTVEIQSRIFLTDNLIKDDRLHRSVLVVAYNRQIGKEFGEETVALVFNPSRTSRTIDLNNPATILSYQDFVSQGAAQIWERMDYVLFLVVLLVTAVLLVSQGSWRPEERLGRATLRILIILAALAITHTLTFVLAWIGLLKVNAVFVNAMIAVCIIAMALMNLMPRYAARGWIVIVVFGLFEGLGLALAMSDLQFRNVLIHKILPRFMIGVELGHLAVFAILFPMLYWLRKSAFYIRGVVYPVSVVAIIIAVLGLLEQVGLVAL